MPEDPVRRGMGPRTALFEGETPDVILELTTVVLRIVRGADLKLLVDALARDNDVEIKGTFIKSEVPSTVENGSDEVIPVPAVRDARPSRI